MFLFSGTDFQITELNLIVFFTSSMKCRVCVFVGAGDIAISERKNNRRGIVEDAAGKNSEVVCIAFVLDNVALLKKKKPGSHPYYIFISIK